ncbi:MAG TPA: hypothetical protein VMG59_12780 [Phycisphaerae bacterium]|nr:hypothetical protein [Phycisphaerae bacterium]
MAYEDMPWLRQDGEQNIYTVYEQTTYSELPIYDENGKQKEPQSGNYIFAKRDASIKGGWRAVCFGQGVLLKEINDPKRQECIKKHGATHLHILFIHQNENQRMAEVEKLKRVHHVSVRSSLCE